MSETSKNENGVESDIFIEDVAVLDEVVGASLKRSRGAWMGYTCSSVAHKLV
jgi:hypothetical protein